MAGMLKNLAAAKVVMTRFLEIVLMVAMTVLVLDVLWGVGTRYLLGEQASWTEELARVLLIWVVLLGGAAAFGSREHLGVDYFVGKMDEGAQRQMKLVVDLVALTFTVAVLIVGGYNLVAETLRLEQMMMAIGVPKGYVYMAAPVSGVFFMFYSVESILVTLFGEPEPEKEAAA